MHILIIAAIVLVVIYLYCQAQKTEGLTSEDYQSHAAQLDILTRQIMSQYDRNRDGVLDLNELRPLIVDALQEQQNIYNGIEKPVNL